MGEPFTFQHAAARTLRGPGDTALSRRHFRRDELLGRAAHARNRTPARSRRATATSTGVDLETGFGADDCWRGPGTRRCVCTHAFVVGVAIWCRGIRRDDVHD